MSTQRLDDALATYESLLDSGIKAENIVLVGDSAGGNLAIALTLYLRDHQHRCLACWCPVAVDGFQHDLGVTNL